MARLEPLRRIPLSKRSQHEPESHIAPQKMAPPMAPQKSAPLRALVAADGGRAELVGDATIEFYDPEGRLLIRYTDGGLEIAPVKGDLKLRAPSGRVQIEAGTDLELRAARDVVVSGGHSAELGVVTVARDGDAPGDVATAPDLPPRVRVDARGPKLTGAAVEVRAQRARAIVAHADLFATAVRTSATTIETTARKIETTAERVALRAKELAHEVSGLLDTRAGRVRSLVKGAFSLQSKNVHMKSEEDTAIDGRRVLLG